MFLAQVHDRSYTDGYMDPRGLDDRNQGIDQFERRVVADQIAALPAGAVVADVPCGNGRMSRCVLERGDLRLVAMDYSLAMLQSMARLDLPALLPCRTQADILSLPLPDRSVDLFINIRLMHHIPDRGLRVRMLREIARVTRGKLVTSFWNSHTWRHLRKVVRGKEITLHPVSPAHFRGVCAEAGLMVERFEHVSRWREKQVLAICRSVG